MFFASFALLRVLRVQKAIKVNVDPSSIHPQLPPIGQQFLQVTLPGIDFPLLMLQL